MPEQNVMVTQLNTPTSLIPKQEPVAVIAKLSSASFREAKECIFNAIQKAAFSCAVPESITRQPMQCCSMTVGNMTDLTSAQGRSPVFSAYYALLPEVHQQDSHLLSQECLQKPWFLQKSPSPVHRG